MEVRMRRFLAVLGAALMILTPAVAQASSAGWARYDAHTYVRWQSPVDRPANLENLTPALARYLKARALAITEAKDGHAKFLEARARARAAAQAQAEVRSGGGGGGRDYHGSVPALVARMFAARGQSVARALCTANRESHFIPTATNRQSGAAGVFQIMPRNWPSWSRDAGYGGASIYSAVANVGTAAYIVEHYGWSPWSGGCT
jgi:hypothetical protein